MRANGLTARLPVRNQIQKPPLALQLSTERLCDDLRLARFKCYRTDVKLTAIVAHAYMD